MQQQSLYQANRQQLLMTGATVFGSIIAAVVVSTLLVMSLMRGEIASALSSNVQNSSPTTQVAGSCVAPAEATDSDMPEAAAAPTTSDVTFKTGSGHLHHTWPIVASVNNSFNSSNTSTTTTTNNVTNTETHTETVIKDSYNDNSTHVDIKIKDSFNPVIIKDNEVNVNSGNTVATTNTTNTVVNTTSNLNSNNVTTVASNNTTNSNNTVENHLLSDNTIVAVLP